MSVIIEKKEHSPRGDRQHVEIWYLVCPLCQSSNIVPDYAYESPINLYNCRNCFKSFKTEE